MSFDLSAQLRAAIQLSGERPARIAAGSGITPSSLSRFMAGKMKLSSNAIDKLTRYLNLTVVSRREWEKRERMYQAWRTGKLSPTQQNRLNL
jgi:transcriptional regulator with XRE-family HTH domain